MRYPNAPAPILDLSTGINPYAYPVGIFDEKLYYRLPDPKEIQTAAQAAKKFYGATCELMFASGMQSLIFALTQYQWRKKGKSSVAILSPTYSEHERVWRAAGHGVAAVEDVIQGADVMVLCNPNNPDGKRHDKKTLLQAISVSPDTMFIIDESFADLYPEISLASDVQHYANLVVLRSVGKFFGLAGLRVSAALCAEDVAKYLSVATGPWPISTAASQLLPRLFADTVWHIDMRKTLTSEMSDFCALLQKYFTLIGKTDLFVLVEHADAVAVAEQFSASGIAVRSFDYATNWLRFGLPDKQYLPRICAVLEGL